jgi:hypothetical protein
MSLDPSHAVGLSRHAELKTRRDGSVLVLPERAIRLGGSGAEILRLVTEQRYVASILSTMHDRYPDSSDTFDTLDTSEVATEVMRFLEEMLRLGGIVDLGECPEKTA